MERQEKDDVPSLRPQRGPTHPERTAVPPSRSLTCPSLRSQGVLFLERKAAAFAPALLSIPFLVPTFQTNSDCSSVAPALFFFNVRGTPAMMPTHKRGLSKVPSSRIAAGRCPVRVPL